MTLIAKRAGRCRRDRHVKAQVRVQRPLPEFDLEVVPILFGPFPPGAVVVGVYVDSAADDDFELQKVLKIRKPHGRRSGRALRSCSRSDHLEPPVEERER